MRLTSVCNENAMARTDRNPWISIACVVLACAVCLQYVAVTETHPEPAPTIGLLGKAVQRWFRNGVRTLIDGRARENGEDGRSGLRDKIRSMLDDHSKDNDNNNENDDNNNNKNGDEVEAESRAADDGDIGLESPLSFRVSPTTEIIARFVSNAIQALQKPDSIVSIMRQKVGFVTSNFRMSCYVCEMGVGIVRSFVYANKTDEEVATTMGNVCNLLTVTSERVCHGFLNEFLPEVMYVLRNIDYLDEEVCGFLLQGNCIGRTYMETFGWSVDIPPKSPYDAQLPPFRRKPYANKLKVLHITDVHVDNDYAEGSTVDCGEPLCCRDKKRGFGFNQHRAGKWGSTGRCDTPARTVESLLTYLKENHEFDYIIWTGDVPPHDIWQQSREDNMLLTKHFNRLLKSYFPNTPIYPSAGNHESAPANSFPPPNVRGPFSIAYLYHALNASWNNLVPGGNISDTVLHGGFYSVLVKPGLRIISLNTNYCHNKNWWMLLDSRDPAGQLEWLVGELEMAEANNEKVHIIGHIPPGSVDCSYVWSDNFNTIVTRFQETIVAQFYGHSHLDEFEIFYDKFEPTLPINVAYIGPSVSPYDGVNPAFKIYYVDGDYEGSPREVLDYETYYMDLEEANNSDMPTWDILYSAKDAFGMRSLDATEWDRLVKKLATNGDMFKEYYKYMYRRGNKKGCLGLCKELTLCRLKKAWGGATKEC